MSSGFLNTQPDMSICSRRHKQKRMVSGGLRGHRQLSRRGSFKRRKYARLSHSKSGTTIDVKLLVKPASPVLHETFTPDFMYSELQIHADLKKMIRKRGYNMPTPIQDRTIPVILQRRNVLGLADTGTGKTAAFLIPLIHHTLEARTARRRYQTLVIVPTRELAQQIEKELMVLTTRDMFIFSALCVGGIDIRRQMKRLEKYQHFIIGTPGRLKDLIVRKKLDLSHCNAVVLDEADRMLDMGFLDDIRYVFGQMTAREMTLMFSATMHTSLQPLIDEFMPDPVRIEIASHGASENVHQDIVRIGEDFDTKFEALEDLLSHEHNMKTLIFTKTKKGAQQLCDVLINADYNAEVIHGDMTQGARKKALDKFREGDVTILVATDVAARGIDVKDITHVINYDVPDTYETYVHRVGRAGRAGRTGWAYTFIER